jgi:cytochrome d ubiquinol oxidase subunit I
MQEPVGYKLVNGEAQLTSVWALLSNTWALWAFGHTMLAGLTAGSAVVFGVCCWHFVRGRNAELFRPAAKLALTVLVPVAVVNLWFGSHFGIYVTRLQPMKISAAEAQWDTCGPCSMSLFQVGGFTESDQTPSFSIQIPHALSWVATGTLDGQVQGLTELNQQYQAMYGPGNYMPPIRTIYWSMRVMVYAGSLVALVALFGAFLLWKRRLERLRWFLWLAVFTSFMPFVAITAGWVLTEMGRQPWIVQGLLKTADANSPAVSSPMLIFSLTVFVCLYLILLVLDVWLMRRYASLDPPELEREEAGATPMPAIGY